MGQQPSIRKISFEDIKYLKCHNHKHYLINTLGANEQDCLISGTLPIAAEVDTINKARAAPGTYIVIYGKNTNDTALLRKYRQLQSLGFTNTFIYPGGMFEWLCLQDIYGREEFPTTCKELDLLRFKPKQQLFNSYMLTNEG